MTQNDSTTNRGFPKAYKHGELRELFDDIFMVTGSMCMKRPMPLSFSRNMTVVRHNGDLTLINSIRLTDNGLAKLDELGTVKHVIRLAGFHGSDDPFYKDRYGASVWAIRDQFYSTEFDQAAAAKSTYFEADVVIDETTELPIPGASLYRFKSTKPGEGLLLLDRDGGILISGDCLQNWGQTDRYFSFIAKFMMKRKGFIKPHNVGPAWYKFTNPDLTEMRGILDLEFEHVVPAHGAEVIGDAKLAFRPAIEALA
jgi:hypothetical protein